eukprot:scaffold188198_cov28-Prasinocladus_malaysianus.AAC.1
MSGNMFCLASWVYLDYKRPHTHDVRALAVVAGGGADGDDLLVSGGIDAQLYCYSMPSGRNVCCRLKAS